MNKKIVFVLVGIVILLVGGFLYFKGKRYEVVISQEKIDASLADQFPASKKFLIFFKISYSNPKVTLLDKDDRVQVGLDATLNIRLSKKLKEIGGTCTVTSGLRYDPEAQEFFLDDAQFDRFEIQGIPKEYLDQVTEFAEKAAKEFVESKPIYRLQAKDAKSTAAKLLLKDFEIRDQSIYITLGL